MAGTPTARSRFVDTMTETGMPPHVAEELEHRIDRIESEETGHESRGALTTREILVYLGVTVAACLIGGAVVVL